jgi:hypothetical protein
VLQACSQARKRSQARNNYFEPPAGWWIYCRGKAANARRESDHILLTTHVASSLPHILKTVFDQARPHRRNIQGHWRGVPFSGKRLEAFPLGHAVHIGRWLRPPVRFPPSNEMCVWSIGAGLFLTWILLLALSQCPFSRRLGFRVRNSYYFLSNFLRRKNKIYTPAGYCALGHIWLPGCFELLRDRNSPHFPYAAQRRCPIAIIARDNDSNDLAVPVLG